MATRPSILAWRNPWTEKPGGLQSMRSQRIGHDWVTNTFTFRVLAENYLKCWETSSVSNRLLTALEDAAMGCSISYKHGDIHVSSLQQAATSKCAAPTSFEWSQGLWPLTFIIVNCQQCQRDGFIQTQQPHFWLLDICYLPSKASDEKDHEAEDRSIIKEQSTARSPEVACLGSTPALSLTGHRIL